MLRIVAILLLLSIIPAGAYFYSHSREAVIAEFVRASQNNDVNAMANRIDFVSVRASLKEDLKRQKSPGLFVAQGGPALDSIDRVIDYYVQPENIAILYYYYDMTFEGIAETQFIREKGYTPLLGFQIVLGMPDTATKGDAMVSSMREQVKARLVFGLDGLTWKVKEIYMPAFMVPAHTYSQTALEVFGPKKR